MRTIHGFGLILVLVGVPSVVNAQLEFELSSTPTAIAYDASGAGSGSVAFSIRELPLPGAPPSSVPSWSVAVGHDPALLETASISQGAYVSSFNGGLGPDFWQANVYPDGFAVGMIHSLASLEFGTYEVEREVVVVQYDTVETTLAGDPDGETAALSFGVPSQPLFSNIVVAGDTDVVPTDLLQPIALLPAGVGFRRGDCNGDQVIDIGDPVSIAETLFAGGPAFACEDACDTNDDGGLDIADVIYELSALFAGGPAIPAPSPGCGADPTSDALGCAASCL